MGYTHYFMRKDIELSVKKFAAFAADVQKAFAKLPEHSESSGGYHAGERLQLAGGDGTGEAKVNNDEICFNGLGESGCETLYIPRVYPIGEEGSFGDYIRKEFARKGHVFDFCKTRRQPYDLAVQVTLILFKHHFKGRVNISSDGDPSDWTQAFDFVNKYFDYGCNYGRTLSKRGFEDSFKTEAV